ncbi:serine hydrolase [Lichenicoccus roseus]|uniref:Serine hydrolase n=1 Tax=Lichenicoccus roseus TaxID=2683649 RepID=A0A5R9JFG3_9PROT|nr:serine hydrolase [Lichenicoccus roseus]TLU73038.1 serine hydrolase [Lichenicoccus roseus]
MLALAVAAPALASPPANFAERVDALRQQIGVPGLSIVVVEHGRTSFLHGSGVRALGKPDPVDADTIFPTGSTGKAFTVAALATLVDAGRIGWDDRVIDRLPGFQMYDPWVTREMTIRDLLVHRSGLGLGEGDLVSVPRSNLSRAEAVHRLRFLKPATSFRSGFAYDNVLYMAAGELIEAVSGKSWEDYVREHVLVPAGMLHSTSDDAGRYRDPDRAFPHARTSGLVRGAGPALAFDEHDELGRDLAPAGGLAISARDMARWLQIQLAHGRLPQGGRLFSEAAHDEMWKPEVLQPIDAEPPALRGTQPMFNTYAMGWEVRDYHGARLVWHAGGMLGFQSIVVLLPDQDVGFAVEINSEEPAILFGLMYELLDHYLGLPFSDWPKRFQADAATRLDAAVQRVRTMQARPPAGSPSAPLDHYAGRYADAWYGQIVVGQQKDGLTIDFRSTPRMSGSLEHWQYDTFLTHFTDPTLEPALVTFALDATGHVARVSMTPFSPVADFSYDYQDLDFRPSASSR